jgi:hypothetical protein
MRAVAIFLSILVVFIRPGLAYDIRFSPEEIAWIGDKIFANECSSRDEYLVSWNDGEDFLSLGIGHFIWYPEDKRVSFEEGFPDFLRFAEISGADTPAWIREGAGKPCPWSTREEFLKRQKDKRVIELRNFIQNTKSLQVEFIIKRFSESVPLMIKTVKDPAEQYRISSRIKNLFSTTQGAYALIDYANFKGMGVLYSETYKGQGWGLLQVLSGMRHEDNAPDAVKEFSISAEKVLIRRVKNSPVEYNERRWLAGWRKRVKAYQGDRR